jgi:hypothetical protein
MYCPVQYSLGSGYFGIFVTLCVGVEDRTKAKIESVRLCDSCDIDHTVRTNERHTVVLTGMLFLVARRLHDTV